MSSIITAILRSTLGLLFDKARDSAASKLKDGDLADEKLREIIVKDLSDIKSKLDCLSLKDLDASYSFLKEGVRLLNLALDKLNEDQKASENPSDEATRVVNNTASGILNAAQLLPQAIQKLRISCDDRFVSAKDRFKASREQATIAFNNKSLSIKDRIMACKLRVAATILESISALEDPEVATNACLLSLEELHGLPTIQEMFAVFLKGGLKSMFKKAERLEIMMSVLFINNALYDFASKYNSKSTNIFTWPGIQLKHRTFHPILDAHEILMSTSNGVKLVQQLSRVIIDWRVLWEDLAVNSCGDIVLLTNDKITVIYRTGESKDVMFPDTTESNVVETYRKSIAVDSNDNVYAVMWRKTRDKDGNVKSDYVLYVFDENYNIKLVSALDFLHRKKYKLVSALDFLHRKKYKDVKIVVNKNQNLIMCQDNQVYIADNTGKLISQFGRDGNRVDSLDISNNNDIMIASDDRSAVKIYTTEGNLKSTIKLPEDHTVIGAAFHHCVCKIIVLTYDRELHSLFLHGYSETGELESSVFLRRSEYFYSKVKSHPNGTVAIQVWSSITLI